ncbi:MAG TPA: hypothetical protein VD931_01525 [Baekduia sp.]|nr:hypothetical protein [Baekduia sp.]
MFPVPRHRRAALAAALALGALAPGAAHAADPVRPATEVIAEVGGSANATKLYLHGTRGADTVNVHGATWNGTPAIMIRSAGAIRAGHGCVDPWFTDDVYCEYRDKVVVNLYEGSDALLAYGSARASTLEVWGGPGNDNLHVQAGGPRPAILLGGNEDDRLVGSTGQEGLFGGPGNDVIRPGGGPDHVDGGHGAFDGSPFIRAYTDNDAECAARTDGWWDRYDDAGATGAEGVDTLDLSDLGEGALADINHCRVGWFDNDVPAFVHAMEHVIGTRFNDRLVGDHERNTLRGGAGRDWLTGEGAADLIEAQDGETDTVKCSVGGDLLRIDAVDQKLGC